MKPRDRAIKELEDAGFSFARHGGNHDIYRNPTTRQSIPIKRHDFNENDLKYIEKEINQSKKGRN